MALNSYLVLFFLGSHHETSTSHRSWTQTETCWDQHLPCCTFIPVANMFFSMLVTPNTLPCFSTHFREQGPCFDSKEVFRGRATGRIPSCGNRQLGRQRASGCLKLDKVGYGSPGHCCHGRHGYYDFIKKWDAPDLCSTSLEWCSNNCQYLETHSFWPKRSMEILQKIPLLSGLCLESSEVWWDAWLGPNG